MSPKKPVNEVLKWWVGLTHAQRTHAHAWLTKNPPPKEWQGTPVEWIHTEMPIPGGW